jgi:asparagine synthase (glutamine-hydrolysing)
MIRIMCGIAGVVRLDARDVDIGTFYTALSLMRHRGPDDEGMVLIDNSTGKFEERGGVDTPQELGLADVHDPTMLKSTVILGNRRLSIIDLSIKAHQPQKNEDHTVWVVLNGEVYNYRELKEELAKAGHKFQSDSDTEVIIHGYEQWGMDLLLSKMIGMWGFALWDQSRGKLYLVRDRFGIKPLYYHIEDAQLIFSSEIKAIRVLFPAKMNDRRIAEFLWFRPYKSDETFFDSINQVMAAHYVELNTATKKLETIRYWQLSEVNMSYEKTDFIGETKTFYQLFEQSIKLHMRSDVPVGTCLSGGLDSSSIVCLSQKLLREGALAEKGLENVRKLKTFSSSPQEKRISEVPYIEEVVRYSDVEPHFMTPTFDDFLKDFEELVSIHDEPFQDPSTYMQYRVIKLAKENGIKVLLDGQGGDECLAGYQRYLRDYLKDLVKEGKYVKAFVDFFRTLDLTAPFFWRYLRKKSGMRQRALAEVITATRPLERPLEYETNNLANRLRYDLLAGSIIEILKYEDTNSMAFSIESRVPFLFHPMIEYLFKLPMTAKINGKWTKFILREAMKGVLPEKVRMRRSKLGFPAPSEEWAKKLIKGRTDLCIETVTCAKDYVDLKNFENLCKRILAKGRSEDIELFWRILILSKWMQTLKRNDSRP